MSLARIAAAKQGALAVAKALDTDPRHGSEYVVALDRAWKSRKCVTQTDRVWFEVRNHLPFGLAEELYGIAVARGLTEAAQALAACIANQYPEVS